MTEKKRMKDIINVINDIRAIEKKYPDMGPVDFAFACHHAAHCYHDLIRTVVTEIGRNFMRETMDEKSKIRTS